MCSCGGLVARARAMVSHARGPEFESASGLHPPCWRNLAWSYTSRLGPVARRQVSSRLTVSLDTGLSHIKPGISIDDAFYPWWGLDVLSIERRLTGECRCRYDSRLKYLTIAEPLEFTWSCWLLRCHLTCTTPGIGPEANPPK